MAHYLNVVPVFVYHESGIVVLVIVMTNAWRAIVFSACSESGVVKRIHKISTFNAKGDMRRRKCGFMPQPDRANPLFSFLGWSDAAVIFSFRQNCIPDGAKGLSIKSDRRWKIFYE